MNDLLTHARYYPVAGQKIGQNRYAEGHIKIRSIFFQKVLEIRPALWYTITGWYAMLSRIVTKYWNIKRSLYL